MSDQDLLSQDEIDALLHGVEKGNVSVEPEEEIIPGEIRAYDLTSQNRIVRGRLPALELINDRFIRTMRMSLFNLLRRAIEIEVGGVQLVKFSEFIHSLFVPTNLNIVRINPLRGRALIVMDPVLVYTAVDNYFGGAGQFYNKIEGREFTPTEMRLIRIILDMVFKDLKDAWAPILDISIEYLNSEVNPQFANIVSPVEVVVISTIRIDLDGGGGNLYIAMPFSMLEPIRELMDSGFQGDKGASDSSWKNALNTEVMDAHLDLQAILAEKTMDVRQLLKLKTGDIIPVDIPEQLTLRIEGVPVFMGKPGISNGKYAVKLTRKIKRAMTEQELIKGT